MKKTQSAQEAAGDAMNLAKEKRRLRRRYGKKEKKPKSWLCLLLGLN